MHRKIIVGIVVIIAVAAGAWMLARNNYSPSDQSSDYSEAGDSQPSAPAEAQMPPINQPASQLDNQPAEATMVPITAIKEFIISGQNFSFIPSALAVKKGDTVKIIFRNMSGTHDFRIDEFNAGTSRIKIGQEQTVAFVADKAGSFEYYCSVGSHREQGMKGTLTVTE